MVELTFELGFAELALALALAFEGEPALRAPGAVPQTALVLVILTDDPLQKRWSAWARIQLVRKRAYMVTAD